MIVENPVRNRASCICFTTPAREAFRISSVIESTNVLTPTFGDKTTEESHDLVISNRDARNRDPVYQNQNDITQKLVHLLWVIV